MAAKTIKILSDVEKPPLNNTAFRSDINHANSCCLQVKNVKFKECHACHSKFHMACYKIKSNKTKWTCCDCEKIKHRKCCACRKTISKTFLPIVCVICENKFHKKCVNIKANQNRFVCDACTSSELPFFQMSDNELSLLTSGIEVSPTANLETLPSFSIKTLLDKLPGKVTIQTGDFTSDFINSKYYTPIEFQKKNFPAKNFSILHINIVSLQAHIDDLKELIRLLNHSFDVIGISETKMQRNAIQTTNIEIDGYDFEQMPTETCFGGVALYIKKCYQEKLRHDLSQSVQTVGESIFLEIEQGKSKNILIGCFYRHHSSLSAFNEDFLSKTLIQISKENKTCILLGDWNVNLLEYENHKDTEDFYELLSSYSFQPLILQPTRVNARSATLIDNIFINDLAISSNGGNIVTSISDHFPQFCSLALFKESQKTKITKKRDVIAISIMMNSKMNY